ncbi:MAG: hypothetical protein LBQ81_08965 [Zoogloeaceae bacterium]|nr:hypothetical protein [Zoogloeaceae bacterium]
MNSSARRLRRRGFPLSNSTSKKCQVSRKSGGRCGEQSGVYLQP